MTVYNVWLIIKREYLERVRTKSFIISTVVLPLALAGVMLLPAKLATMRRRETRHLVIATANREYGEAIRAQLTSDGFTARYRIDLDSVVTDAERNILRDKVTAGEIDAYLWLPDDAVASRQATFAARDTNDFIETESLKSALRFAAVTQELRRRGATASEATDAIRAVKIEVLKTTRGKESKFAGTAEFLSIVVLVLLLYVTLILSGVAVMRSVLEEKASRMVEVLLSCATAGQLMAGKILGIGAVGLTQVVIWVATLGLLSSPALIGARLGHVPVQIQLTALPFFLIFYILGYVLYSSMYAALGAMVNSEQEAQQWQMLITMPLIAATVLMTYVMRQPASALALGASLVPFFAPVLMYMRIVVQTPPWWQIAGCIALMLGTTWGIVVLCARIYRIGILMYGKKPTLPELAKWLKYAAQ